MTKIAFRRVTVYDREAIAGALGEAVRETGFDSARLSGKNVLLKPNILRALTKGDPAATHVEIVAAAAIWAKANGAKSVTMSDVPGVQKLEKAAELGGYREAAEKIGFEIRPFADFRRAKNPNAQSPYRELEIAADVFADGVVVINLPKLKTHGMTTMTGAVKNLFGTIRPSERIAWHLKAGMRHDVFGDMLIDTFEIVSPVLNIVDAIVAMEGNGPASGTPVATNFIAAATDAHALDYTLAGLIGAAPDDVCTLRRARERGLIDPAAIGKSGEIPAVAAFKIPPPPVPRDHWGIPLPISKTFWKNCFTPAPVCDYACCTGCGICARVCPAGVIVMSKDGRPSIDLKRCIRCFCCQEHCPEGAMRIRTGLLYKLRRWAFP